MHSWREVRTHRKRPPVIVKSMLKTHPVLINSHLTCLYGRSAARTYLFLITAIKLYRHNCDLNQISDTFLFLLVFAPCSSTLTHQSHFFWKSFLKTLRLHLSVCCCCPGINGTTFNTSLIIYCSNIWLLEKWHLHSEDKWAHTNMWHIFIVFSNKHLMYQQNLLLLQRRQCSYL